MPGLQSITRKREGVAISIDALLAIMLFIALVAFISVEPVSNLPLTQPTIVINQIVDDAISAIDSTGFIMETVENRSGQTKAELEADMQQKLEGLLPEKVGFRVEMQQYSSNLDDPASTCRAAASTFDDCFPDAPTEYIATGSPIPTDQEVFHGRKIFIKKEPGDCDLITLKEKKGKEPILAFEEGKEEFTVLRFAAEICDNSIDDDADTLIDCDDPACSTFPDCVSMNFTFTSTVTVAGEDTNQLECDQTADVELRINRGANTRKPIDVIFAASKNTTMAECMIAAGKSGPPLLDDGENTDRDGFERVAAFDFAVSAVDANAFDLVLSWQDACSPNCPEFRIKSPTDINYGEGQATTQQNSTECNETNPAVKDKAGQSVRAYYYNNRTYYRYLALGSALAETGTWEVWVKNTAATDYDIYAKYIDNEHWVETNPAQILPWDEPISKVDLAKVLITEFANRAEWQVTDSDTDQHDKYAYAEIGLMGGSANQKSSIQPNNGLKDAKDLGPPISSQLKNLDRDINSIPQPSYVHALVDDANRLINWRLYDHHPEWVSHTKFAIIYADSSDNPADGYIVDDAIASVDRDSDGYNEIYYYTIDLSNDLILGNDNCQNNDLYRLGWETGGRCYAASDESMLDVILDIIMVEIGDKAGIDPDADSTLALDFQDDFNYSFFNGSITHPHSWDGPTNTLTFQNVTVINGIWTTDFEFNIPCDFANCEDFFQAGKTIEIPPSDTSFYYEIDGNTQAPVNWPIEQITTVLLKFRDLAIEFIAGYFYGVNEVSVEYEVSNVGYFDVDLADVIPTVNFYTAELAVDACDPAGPRAQIGIDNLTGIVDAAFPVPGPDTSERAIKGLSESGNLCLYLNELQSVSECSGNNAVVVQCDIPKTVVYVLDYWAWEK